MTNPSKPQPEPTKGNAKVLDLVLSDLEERAEDGNKRYGTYLETHNGRDALIDLYQELLDACMYIRQLIEEEKEQREPSIHFEYIAKGGIGYEVTYNPPQNDEEKFLYAIAQQLFLDQEYIKVIQSWRLVRATK